MATFFEATQFSIVGQASALTWSPATAHTVMVGAPRAFIDACAGVGPHQGELRLFGMHPAEALRGGMVTYVPCHWTQASTRTPRMLVTAAVALLNQTADVEQTLKHFELVSHANKKVSTLTPALQRATVFACAHATQSQAFLFDDPFCAANDPRAFAELAEQFRDAFAERSWIAFARDLATTEPWQVGAHVLRLHNGVVDTRTYRTRYLVQTAEPGGALLERLQERGVSAQAGPHSCALYLDTMPNTAMLFQNAEETGTRIVRFEQVEVE
jgi:energy-coupling factor transporter ATP-binding protein EcfA2